MHIASIDPGVTTGLVIAKVIIGTDYVRVSKEVACELYAPSIVLENVFSHACSKVVIERRPHNASKEGTDTYEAIYRTLKLYKFTETLLSLSPLDKNLKQMYLYGPGQWKPFMRSRRKDVFPGERFTSHIADAANLLHYFLVLNNLEKRIVYVS